MVGGRRERRVVGGVLDRLADRAAVERAVDAVAPEQLVGLREVRVLDRRADVARRAVGVEIDRRRRRDVVEVRRVRRRLVEEGLVDREALARDVGAIGDGLAQRVGAVAAQDVLPQRRGAGHADAQAAVAVDRELRVGRWCAVDEERVRLDGLRRGLTRVQRRDLAGAAVADRHEAAATDAAAVRLDDAEHARGRDRRVEGVAAPGEDVGRGPRRERIDARRRSAGSRRRRLLLLRPGGRCGQRYRRHGRPYRQPANTPHDPSTSRIASCPAPTPVQARPNQRSMRRTTAVGFCLRSWRTRVT